MSGDPCVLREVHADDWQRFRAVRLAALRDAPDAFGATLAQWQGVADTEARWRARLTAVPFNVLAERAGAAIGMIGATSPVDGAVEAIALYRRCGFVDLGARPPADGQAAESAMACALGARPAKTGSRWVSGRYWS